MVIEVAAAIIENNQGQILIARRKKGKSQEGMWEFPGGKLEKDETIESCIQRELMEEMNITVIPIELFGVNDHSYETFQIRLIAYKVKYVKGPIQLVDHDAYCWVERSHLNEFAFAPADLRFVEMLLQGL